jgi:hypothetical protein
MLPKPSRKLGFFEYGACFYAGFCAENLRAAPQSWHGLKGLFGRALTDFNRGIVMPKAARGVARVSPLV